MGIVYVYILYIRIMLIFKYKKKKDLNSVFYKVFKKIKIYKRIIGKNFY